MLKLVVICLAASAVALATLVIATDRQNSSFRGTTPEMLTAFSTPAKVLAADAEGAITQTGNGIVAGYLRGQTGPSWRFKFERFPPLEQGEISPPDDAEAWCVDECPAAIVKLRGSYSQHGARAENLAEMLTKLGPDQRLLDLIDARRALVAESRQAAPANFSNLKLINGSRIERLPVRAASAAYADRGGFRVVAGSPDGNIGTLSRMIRSGGRWRSVQSPVVETGLQNICISPNGGWVGAISTRIQLLPFLGSSPVVAGNPVSGGVCRADSRGFTATVNPTARPGEIGAVRLSHDGRRLWARSFGTQRLISPGESPLIVTISTGTHTTITATDAVTGEPRLHRAVSTVPRVGEDGAIVTTDRSGLPVWITLER